MSTQTTHHFLAFAQQHWSTIALFLIILVLLFQEELKQVLGGSNTLSPGELVHWMNHKNALVLDLRPQVTYSKQHIIHSVQITESDLLSIFNIGSSSEEKPSMPHNALQSIRRHQKKGRPIVLVCANGNASLRIAKKLTRNGIGDTYALLGGITAWKEEHFPLAVEKTV